MHYHHFCTPTWEGVCKNMKKFRISMIFFPDRSFYHIPYARHYKPRLVYFYPISKDHFFVFKEVFSENSVLMYGLYSRAASNQERLMMARVRYLVMYTIHIVSTPNGQWPNNEQHMKLGQMFEILTKFFSLVIKGWYLGELN